LREENGSAWGCWKKGRRRKIETREREREKGKEKKERKKKKTCSAMSLYKSIRKTMRMDQHPEAEAYK
jgi:hypothetical protein